MPKLRAEMFWTDRWITSSAAFLPIEMRGLYREMLTMAWMYGGSLPDDPAAIKRAIRCTDAEWDRCWPTVKRYWHVRRDDGRLVNDTQLEVYAKSLRMHTQRIEAAQSRWGRQIKMPAYAKRNANGHAKRDAGKVRAHMDLDLGSGSGILEQELDATNSRRARARGKNTKTKPRAVEKSK